MAGPLTAEDRLAVIDLIADYAFRLDIGDTEGYIANFAPDGVIINRGTRYEGHAAIRAWLNGLVDTAKVGREARLLHVIGIPTIRGDSERCQAEAPVFLPGHRDDPNHISTALVGAYLLDVVKIDGRWRFAVRDVRHDLESPGY
jgi:hypothetical protein